MDVIDPRKITPHQITQNSAEPSLFDKTLTDILRLHSELNALKIQDKDAPTVFLCLTHRAAPAARPLMPQVAPQARIAPHTVNEQVFPAIPPPPDEAHPIELDTSIVQVP